MILKKALFIEIDEVVINTISGNINPIHSADWKLDLEIVDLIAYYKDKDYIIVLVSNNSNLSEKLITENNLNVKLNEICTKIEKINKIKRNSIQYIYYNHKNTFDTLPNPGLFYKIAEDLEMSLFNSIYIGKDNFNKDIPNNAGINYIQEKSTAFQLLM